MADQPTPPFVLASLMGGYNDTDEPQALRDNECTAATNVEWFDATLGERRKGCSSLDLTSSALTDETYIVHLSQWFPTNSVMAPEYVAFAATPGSTVSIAYRDTSGTWHEISGATLKDAVDPNAPNIFDIVAQPLGATDFIAYDAGSSVDRLHIWDGTDLRRAGLTEPAPTQVVTDTGSGNFSGPRYYRERFITIDGSGVIVRRSEPSGSVRFVPSGTGAGANVTRVGLISEGETHWELEASETDQEYYRIATVPIATTSYDDTTAASKSYPTAVVTAPVSNDGTSITYVLLSDQAAALCLTGTVPNGTYGNPSGTIAGRGYIGYSSAAAYYPAFTGTWTAGDNWWASPDVATDLEAQASGDSGNYAAVGTLSEAVGAYLTQPAARFLAVDGDRIIYGGHFFDDAQASTVGWSPTTNDPGVGNHERAPIVTTGGEDIVTTADLDNYDGGPLTGLAAATFGTWYAFKWQRIYAATRTKDVTNAYDIETISTQYGAIPNSIIKVGSTIYFLDPFVGPCRLGTGGVVLPIHGVRGTWARVNLKATSKVCCGLYYPYKQQLWWTIAVDGGNIPGLGLKIQVSEMGEENGELRGGISFFDGMMAASTCMATLTYTSGNVTTDWPFLGMSTPNFVQRGDNGTDDNGTAFTGTVTSKAFFPFGLLNKWGVLNGRLLATADSNGSIKATLTGLTAQEGLASYTTAAASTAPVTTESQVSITFDDQSLTGLLGLQITITDGTAGKNWHAQRLDLRTSPEEGT